MKKIKTHYTPFHFHGRVQIIRSIFFGFAISLAFRPYHLRHGITFLFAFWYISFYTEKMQNAQNRYDKYARKTWPEPEAK